MDASSGRVVVAKRGLSEGAEASFKRVCGSEGLSVGDCQWQECDRVEIYL